MVPVPESGPGSLDQVRLEPEVVVVPGRSPEASGEIDDDQEMALLLER